MKTKLLGVVAALALCAVTSPAYSERIGFLLNEGTVTNLSPPIPGFQDSVAQGINNSGQIVGSSFGSVTQGFLYSGGNYNFLVPNAQAMGINDAGQIVGAYNQQAFLYTGGNYTTFAVPGQPITIASGINNAGQIVGRYNTGSSQQGFLYNGSNFTTLSFPGAVNSAAFGINNAGQIVGDYQITGGHSQGFLYSGGNYIPIDVPGASNTVALGINNEGMIVGTAYTNNGIQGFLYDYNAALYTLFSFGSGGETQFFGINDQNQIVGYYFRQSSEVPLPPSILLHITGLGVLGLLGWRRKRPTRKLLEAI